MNVQCAPRSAQVIIHVSPTKPLSAREMAILQAVARVGEVTADQIAAELHRIGITGVGRADVMGTLGHIRPKIASTKLGIRSRSSGGVWAYHALYKGVRLGINDTIVIDQPEPLRVPRGKHAKPKEPKQPRAGRAPIPVPKPLAPDYFAADLTVVEAEEDCVANPARRQSVPDAENAGRISQYLFRIAASVGRDKTGWGEDDNQPDGLARRLFRRDAYFAKAIMVARMTRMYSDYDVSAHAARPDCRISLAHEQADRRVMAHQPTPQFSMTGSTAQMCAEF